MTIKKEKGGIVDNLHKIKIMLIDDDRETLDEMQEMLRMSGYETATFQNALSALKEIKEYRPDLILVDLKMNVMNGFQFAQDVRRNPETTHIPIIAMTGYFTEKEHLLLTKVCGIRKRLIKPVRPQDVEETINEILSEESRP